MKKIVLLTTMIFSSFAFGECIVKYERTACAGQEAISYKKCGGEKTCVKKKRAKDEAKCKKAATKSCKNKRLDITKSKVITATWNGKKLLTDSGKADFCLEYDKKDVEFNKCDAK